MENHSFIFLPHSIQNRHFLCHSGENKRLKGGNCPMKKFLLYCLIVCLLSSCAVAAFPPERPPRPVVPVEETLQPETFTLFWYVNGSDLESGGANDLGGAFSDDLDEMMSAIPPDGRFRVLIFTGGTREWKTEGFSARHNQVHHVTNEGLSHGSVLPEGSIAEPEVLEAFLRYGIETVPADRYGLIFWDHGSGVPIGFGYDELREPRYMDMTALASGLEGGLGGEKLAFIGFDACLMATAEVAAACAPFAEVLIASQELEPFSGWDYAPLMRLLGKNPAADAEEIGRVIVNGYFSSRAHAGETLTLSVVDLNKIGAVADAAGELAGAISRLMEEEGFPRAARVRSRVKSYGGIGQSVDMIDIVHLAQRARGYAPEKAENLIQAVRECVLVNRHTAGAPNSNGLSVYFPYENEGVFKNHLDLYLQSDFSGPYLEMVREFTERLKQGDASVYMVGLKHTSPIPDEWHITDKRWVLSRRRGRGVYTLIGLDKGSETPPERWLTVNGNPAFAYSGDGTDGIIQYSVLAERNGEKVNLAASCKNGQFTFLGAIPEAKDGRAPLPVYQPVEKGDTVTLLYPKIDVRRPGHEEEYMRGASFVVERPMVFSFAPVKGVCGLLLTDCYNNEYVTDVR
jgi:hypothetical protein